MSASVPLIGIGVSAGGLEALAELLDALPPRLDAAVIVVQHLDRSRESLFAEILSRKTPLAVTEATHGLIPRADSIYVIAPDVTLTVVDGRLHLDARPTGRVPHLPVDALFKSIAQERGGSGIGIVLAGADSDGAAGIQAIKSAGGITFAQEPRTARVAGMPRSAIDTGCVDFVLAPARIAAELARIVSHPYLRTVPDDGTPDSDDPIVEGASEVNLKRIFRRLRSAHGVDFSRYKPATLRRRLARRMALRRIDNIEDYVALLEDDSAEVAALYQDFLIRVTSFFRDPEVFDALAEQVFPDICAARSPQEPIRIWVAGCATGEEVYSIAIALVEFLSQRSLPIGVQVFGTDVSELAIQKARSGRYLDSIAQDLSVERLNRFFVKDGEHYCVMRSIRELCVFARQDVTRDPPFSRLDLVSCRNLLIHLSSLSQQRVMQIFHYALRQRGILMLGPAESLGHMADLFEVADERQRFYKPKLRPPGVGFEHSRPFAPVTRLHVEDEAQRVAPRRDLALDDSAKDQHIAQLERENTDLRLTIEQHEAAGEELRCAHEEVLSANEELQSTNEELRAGNRQLQALNGEVDKARALAQIGGAYADEIIETVREPLLVLDEELRIIRANRAFYSLFDLRPGSGENRPVHEIGDIEWNADALRAQLLQVVAHGEPLVDFEIACILGRANRRRLCLNARRIAADAPRAPLILLSIEEVTEAPPG